MPQMLAQPDVTAISDIMRDCPVIPVNLVKQYLKKRDKSFEQIDKIINQMLKRKIIYYDESKSYFVTSKMYGVGQLEPGKIKGLWLVMALYDSINCFFVQNDMPHVLTFSNPNCTDGDMFFDVFYIRYGDENLSSFTINSKFKKDKPIKIFIILDDKKQIPKLRISEKDFIIYQYVLVDLNGNVEFLGGGD